MDGYNDILSIVVDLGFENTKIGYSGDETPTTIFNASVGIPLDLDIKIKNEAYKKCLCTKEEFYQFSLIYPLFYLEPLENAKIKSCLYLDGKNSFNINEDVLEKILFMNINGDRSVNNILEKRIKGVIGNKLLKQTDLGKEFDNKDTGDGATCSGNKEGEANVETGTEEAAVDMHSKSESSTGMVTCITAGTPNGLDKSETGNAAYRCSGEKMKKSDEWEKRTTLSEWSRENNYFDVNLIENKLVDINMIKNMINKYNNVSCGLNEKIENFPYLFSLPNKRNKQIKVKITELLFEKYKVPSLYLNSKSLLTGFAYNRKVCSVVDVGSCYTDFSLCNDGIIDDKNYKIFNIGGKTVDSFLEELLEKHNNQCCIPYYECWKNKRKNVYNKDRIHIDYYNKAKYFPVKDLKSYLCEVANSENDINNAKNMIFKENFEIYILPDGQNINITKFNNIACEIFFTPSILNNTKLVSHLDNVFMKEEKFQGLSTTLFNILKNIKLDNYKKELTDNVILTGSSTLFDNFDERFSKEINQLDFVTNYNSPNFQILNSGKYDKQFSSWKGGSILSSFKNFSSFFVTRKEYEEFGFDIIARKC
ncbi:actin-like protein, putative [Plasmodium ovale]|uniref:Actin-like protein, putative n=2 Tax=Plasmodium ovale TaxID=36330 RepID=A0A1D3U8Z2_PLAOA|nr:actin-like protein, putative (ALP2b) [Plasmodium ovale curtisi]SBS93252.1 actin-like protein, putative (ALP2b) [Plasmodium ovale curtisi]SCQ16610.1 actin-like protein, putative [Plasmodium ovale]